MKINFKMAGTVLAGLVVLFGSNYYNYTRGVLRGANNTVEYLAGMCEGRAIIKTEDGGMFACFGIQGDISPQQPMHQDEVKKHSNAGDA